MILYCDQSDCVYCVKGQCVCNVVKHLSADSGGPIPLLGCESYKSRFEEADESA